MQPPTPLHAVDPRTSAAAAIPAAQAAPQTGLTAFPVPVSAEGAPIDADKHRRILTAKRLVAEAYAMAPPSMPLRLEEVA